MSKCLQCGTEVKQTEGRRQRKFCDNKGKCRYQYWLEKNKEGKRKTVQLPKDFIGMNKIGILRTDGTIEELKTIDQLPKEMTDIWKLGLRGLAELKSDAKVEVKYIPNKDTKKHKLWKEGDPKENSMAFYSKYDCANYAELEQKLKPD